MAERACTRAAGLSAARTNSARSSTITSASHRADCATCAGLDIGTISHERARLPMLVSRQKRRNCIDESGGIVERDVVVAVGDFFEFDVRAARFYFRMDLRRDALAAVAFDEERRYADARP